jgi:hypothetical protein
MNTPPAPSLKYTQMHRIKSARLMAFHLSQCVPRLHDKFGFLIVVVDDLMIRRALGMQADVWPHDVLLVDVTIEIARNTFNGKRPLSRNRSMLVQL